MPLLHAEEETMAMVVVRRRDEATVVDMVVIRGPQGTMMDRREGGQRGVGRLDREGMLDGKGMDGVVGEGIMGQVDDGRDHRAGRLLDEEEAGVEAEVTRLEVQVEHRRHAEVEAIGVEGKAVEEGALVEVDLGGVLVTTVMVVLGLGVEAEVMIVGEHEGRGSLVGGSFCATWLCKGWD
jgi:hypothetical protein